MAIDIERLRYYQRQFLGAVDFEAEQEYLEDTNVLRTCFRRDTLTFTLTDFVHPETHVIVRRFEVANFGREPYSYIQRTEQRYQFSDNLSWTLGRHNTKLGADFNYIPLKAIFTVNYGGVYDFGSFDLSSFRCCGRRYWRV